jgi:hypothetical protein
MLYCGMMILSSRSKHALPLFSVGAACSSRFRPWTIARIGWPSVPSSRQAAVTLFPLFWDSASRRRGTVVWSVRGRPKSLECCFLSVKLGHLLLQISERAHTGAVWALRRVSLSLRWQLRWGAIDRLASDLGRAPVGLRIRVPGNEPVSETNRSLQSLMRDKRPSKLAGKRCGSAHFEMFFLTALWLVLLPRTECNRFASARRVVFDGHSWGCSTQSPGEACRF